ncbi:hypothetical protein [Limnohabitans sp.]|uniref:hypothetical protein n=1 Tax=Limnohabitans sp. TaxID=1907725 RepID=UPI00286F3B9B|nr:hypothetical protein [Limnohabitans sp.]
MSRQPIAAERRAMQTPRERIWAAMQSFKGKPFTEGQVQDKCEPMVPLTAVTDYVKALDKAQIIERAGLVPKAVKELGDQVLWVVKTKQYDAPRVNKQGKLVTSGMGTQAMWACMKVMPRFDYKDVAKAASINGLVVTPATAKSYVILLTKAGILSVVKPSKPNVPAVLRLAYNTGPHAPAITRQKVVFDRNTGRAFPMQNAQELADELE